MRFTPARQAIAVLNISGRISDATSLSVFTALRRVDWQKRGIVAILLRVCSEGGSLAAAQAIAESLALLRDETGIVIACVIEDIAVSAAFGLALSADFVTATAAASVGGVGAVVGTYDVRDLERKLGLGYRSITSSPIKSQWDIHGIPTAAGQAAVQGLVDDVHTQFVEWVCERRKLASIAPEAIDGRMLTGRQAHRLGLIDATGGTPTAIAYLARQAP
jgi:protease-4